MADIKSSQGKAHLEKTKKRNEQRKEATIKRNDLRSKPQISNKILPKKQS